LLVVPLLLGIGCAQNAANTNTPAERDNSMFDTLINIINRSDEVLAAKVTGSQPVTVDGLKWVRASADVVEVFKGAQPPKTINYDVEFANKETPQTKEGKTYILFIKKSNDRRLLEEKSNPVGVVAEKQEKYFQLIRDYVAAASAKDHLKSHLLKVLDSGIPFFVEDAAKNALLIEDWTPAELEKIKILLAPNPPKPMIEGNPRDNLVALLIGKGTATQALAQARMEFKHDNPDAVYYGLSRRKNPDVDHLLASFLKDPEPSIRLGAVRVTGLLRKSNVLDQFEQQNKATMDESTRSALAEARKLVGRD